MFNYELIFKVTCIYYIHMVKVKNFHTQWCHICNLKLTMLVFTWQKLPNTTNQSCRFPKIKKVEEGPDVLLWWAKLLPATYHISSHMNDSLCPDYSTCNPVPCWWPGKGSREWSSAWTLAIHLRDLGEAQSLAQAWPSPGCFSQLGSKLKMKDSALCLWFSM